MQSFLSFHFYLDINNDPTFEDSDKPLSMYQTTSTIT